MQNNLICISAAPGNKGVIIDLVGDCDQWISELYLLPAIKGLFEDYRAIAGGILLSLEKTSHIDSTSIGGLVKLRLLADEAGIKIGMVAPARSSVSDKLKKNGLLPNYIKGTPKNLARFQFFVL